MLLSENNTFENFILTNMKLHRRACISSLNFDLAGRLIRLIRVNRIVVC